MATTFVSTLFAGEGAVPKGVPHLDHVFVIMMENHGYSQIVNNPNAPFTNQYAKSANSATNYFAIADPSLTNYLEVVGGSNFGVHSDNNPDWHNLTCITNLATGIANTDNPPVLTFVRSLALDRMLRRQLLIPQMKSKAHRAKTTLTELSTSLPLQTPWGRPSPIS